MFIGHFAHRLQKPELQSSRCGLDHLGCIHQSRCRLIFPFRIDHLRSPVSLDFCLSCHRPFHVFREYHITHLHGHHLDPPGLGLPVDTFLDVLIDLIPLGKKLVQLHLTHCTPECGLGQHRGSVDEFFHLNHSCLCIHDSEKCDRIHIHGHIVLGDHLLLVHVDRQNPKIHPLNLIDEGNQKYQTRSLRTQVFPQPKNHCSFIFPHNFKNLQHQKHKNHHYW